MPERWHDELCEILTKIGHFFEASLKPPQKGMTILLPEGYGLIDVAYKMGIKVKIKKLDNVLRPAFDRICDLTPVVVEVEDLRSWASPADLVEHLKDDIKKMMYARPLGILVVTNEKLPEELKVEILKKLWEEEEELSEIYKEKLLFLHLSDHEVRKIKELIMASIEKRRKFEEFQKMIDALAFSLSDSFVKALFKNREVVVEDSDIRKNLKRFLIL